MSHFPPHTLIFKHNKTHIKSVDQENTNKTTRKITEKIISEYIKTKNYRIIDKHGGILRYSIGLKDKFYFNNRKGEWESLSDDHSIGDEKENDRIKKAGGKINAGYLVLG